MSEQRRASPKAVVALVFLGGALGFAKQTIASDCEVKNAPQGWLTFVDRLQNFCFAYPPWYRSITPAAEPGRWSSHEVEIVQLRSRDARYADPGDHAKAAIEFWLSKTEFNLHQLASKAPTGVIVPPSLRRAGKNQVYFYGPGGGGVAYPDRYYFNLRGKTLEVDFDGPYNGKDKSPVHKTSEFELKLLATLTTF